MNRTASSPEGVALRPYTSEQFIRLVEGVPDDRLQAYMQCECEFLTDEESAGAKSFIDMGAGHGRALPIIAPIGRDVFAVEFNPKMLDELERRAATYENVSVINGDMQELPALLSEFEVVHPVVIILQNTLGTVDGDRDRVLAAMRDVARGYWGSVIISLFRAQALGPWGIGMYSLLSEMVGNPDLERTDSTSGVFVSTTGYTSKWWTDEEVEDIKAFFGGHLVRQVSEPEFVMFEIGLG